MQSSMKKSLREHEENFVLEEVAFQQAVAAMLEHLIAKTPSLVVDAEPAQLWQEGMIGASFVLYDINGEPLFYSYPVMASDDNTIGSIWVAANKLLGVTAASIKMGSTSWHVEEAMEYAHALVVREYPDWQVESILPVIYDYPKIGIMVTLFPPRSRERMRKLIMELSDFSWVPEEEPKIEPISEARPHRDFSYSFLDNIPREEWKERLQQWTINHNWSNQVNEILREAGGSPGDLKVKPLGSIVDLKVVADRIKQWIKYEIYATTPVPLYCQTAVPYCSAAVGRMIAAYYGVYHSEAHVASVMSITQQHWPTADDELKYYKSAQGLKKANSVKYESLAYLKNWTNYKNELQAGRPSSLRTGWHSHVLAGIRVRTSAPGVQLVDIGLVDPFPADNCPKSQSCNTYKIPKCKGGAWEPFYFRKTVWKAHVIPKD